MIFERTCFHSYHFIPPKRVILEDDMLSEAVGKRHIFVDIEVNGHVKKISIKDVFWMSKLKANLLSLRHLITKHLHVEFSHEGCFMLSPKQDHVAIIYEINACITSSF